MALMVSFLTAIMSIREWKESKQPSFLQLINELGPCTIMCDFIYV